MNVTGPQKIPLYRFVLRDSGAKQINEGGSAELKYDKRMTVHLDGEKGQLGFRQDCHPCEIILLDDS